MATVNEKMTALADEVRELSGTTTVKSINTMTTDINAANIEIAEQTELLEQIATALENKTAGGGGSGGAIETWSGTIEVGVPFVDGTLYYTDANLTMQTVPFSGVGFSINAVKETFICFKMGSGLIESYQNAIQIFNGYSIGLLQLTGDNFVVSLNLNN